MARFLYLSIAVGILITALIFAYSSDVFAAVFTLTFSAAAAATYLIIKFLLIRSAD